uniref:Uncharacterized protein n=1 Tax=Rhizophora mucronata TaxID=61149 RepID=A0A2P2J2Q2_RHIMU
MKISFTLDNRRDCFKCNCLEKFVNYIK